MLRKQIAAWGRVGLHPPATAEAIKAAESTLGAQLPAELKDLLGETNGVDGELGLALVWPVERIADDNAYFRSDPTFADLYLAASGAG